MSEKKDTVSGLNWWVGSDLPNIHHYQILEIQADGHELDLIYNYSPIHLVIINPVMHFVGDLARNIWANLPKDGIDRTDKFFGQ